MRCVRAGRVFALLGGLVLFSSCTTAASVVEPAPGATVLSDEDDFSELIAQLNSDLNRLKSRQTVKSPTRTPAKEARRERDREFAERARSLFSRIDQAVLNMPVVGVQPYDLANSWGDARDGGKRKHRGIDIFAPRGTAVVAVEDGVISFIGEQPKGGRCLWLTTENGRSFYYAHLDRWAPGLYEGMEVSSGDLLGYVGNTGNAKRTPPHLHFGVNDNDVMVNPYPILTRALVVKRARSTVEAAGALGTR